MIKNKNKKGFTLVELLVVIAIIGILSSIAIIGLNSSKEKARIAAKTENLRRLTSLFILCLEDNKALSFDFDLQNQSIQESGPLDQEICANSSDYDTSDDPQPINWLDYLSDGWAYVQVDSNTTNKTWDVLLMENDGDGPKYIHCETAAGCFYGG